MSFLFQAFSNYCIRHLTGSSLGLLVESWTGDPGSSQSTVPIWVFTQVLLVVVLGVVEWLRFSDFCCNWTKTFVCKNLKVAAKRTLMSHG